MAMPQFAPAFDHHPQPTDGVPLVARIPAEQWRAFFQGLYMGFGAPETLVDRCVSRAYRDFNRTWHGAKGPKARRSERRGHATHVLISGIRYLQERSRKRRGFEDWHARTLAQLSAITDPDSDGSGLTLGQAQKWINMSIKYAIGSRTPGLDWVEPLAHIPIDRIVLAELGRRTEFRPALDCLPGEAWSRLRDAVAYRAFQRRIRTLAAPNSPLSLEFDLWLSAQANETLDTQTRQS